MNLEDFRSRFNIFRTWTANGERIRERNIRVMIKIGTEKFDIEHVELGKHGNLRTFYIVPKIESEAQRQFREEMLEK